MRGFFGGLLAGLVLCGGGLVVVSVLSPLAPAPGVDPDAEQLAMPKAEEVLLAQGGADPDIDTQVPESPVPLDPDPADLGGLARLDQTLVPEPELTTEAAPLVLPEQATGHKNRPAAEMPVQAGDRPEQVAAEVEQDTAIEAETSRPAAPVVSSETHAEIVTPIGADGQGAGIEISAEDTPRSDVPPRSVAPEPAAGRAPSAVTMPVPAEAATSIGQPDQVTVSDTPDVPAQESEVARAPQAGAVPIPDVDQSIEVTDNSSRAPLPQIDGRTQSDGPMIGERVIPLTERGKPVEPEAPAIAAQTAMAEFAQPYDNPENKPLLAVVLIDDGQAAALSQVPFPVTIAIDPARAGAAGDMARHRAAGHEILALVDLPQGFTAADTEVSLSAGMDILSEAVGLIEGAGMQAGQEQAAQLVAFSKAGGFGVVTRPVGLNLTRRLAEQIDVPTAPVFRDFGGENLDRSRMRRFLEAAIVRADQDGAAIVVGQLRPDTLRTLESWSQQARARRVTLAPVSAALEQDGTGR